jgi:DNA-binding NarL/FixJ family response regulator
VICERRSGYHHTDSWSCRITDRESRVLELYAMGLNRVQIGQRVGLSERTVGRYLTIAKEKLGASTLVQAVVLALRDSGNVRSHG